MTEDREAFGGLDSGEMLDHATEPDPNPPRGLEPLWFLYLFFRPRRFFEHFGSRQWLVLTIVCALLFGLASAVDRIETRGSLGRIPSVVSSSWAVYWAGVAFSGLLSAILVFFIGGWWYRVRLRFSGARGVDAMRARRVYVFAAQVYAIPSLIYAVLMPLFYATPQDAWDQTPWWVIFMVIFPFWSFTVSFIGVRTVFDVKPLRAAFWFLALPVGFTLLTFGGLVLLFAMLGLTGPSVVAGPPADVSRPLSYTSQSMEFDYPGNWFIDTEDPAFDPDMSVSLLMPQDASVTFSIYESDDTPAQEVAASNERIAMLYGELTPVRTSTTWGPLQGHHEIATIFVEGYTYEVVIFASDLGDGWMFEAVEVFPQDAKTQMQPGFALIRSTFRLK
ncbi:MAG: Yip1 family protein [Planctomycetota bacterium]